MSNSIELGIYRKYHDVKLPTWGTNGSACFDIRAYIQPYSDIITYTPLNEKIVSRICVVDYVKYEALLLRPGHRALIPTGLILDIPEGYSVRIHPRSGLSLKNGVTLINGEGVVDYDYTNELFISIINTSDADFFVENGARLAQGELVEVIPTKITTIIYKPKQKLDRKGGFGHTGE